MNLHEAKPFIIAEVGSNWKTFEEAKDSISMAKQCGADAVKFQLFNHKALYGLGGNEFVDGLLLPEWLPKLKEKADACDIEFMCTAFSPKLVDVVDPYVNIHKIASSDLCYPQLLERVKSKGKPILLSTGASSKGDIEQALDILIGKREWDLLSGIKPRQESNIILMYCVSAYPSRMFNLFHMQSLKETFNVPVGLSDHSIDVFYPALSAVKHFGATVIEKHVNFTEHKDTPDAPHSLNAEDFKYMCDILRGIRPYDVFNPQPEERDMFLRHNRRLIAIKDIKAGDTFEFDVNFGAYRSLKDDTQGMSPFAWSLVQGQKAKVDIKAGDSIKSGDF